MRVAAILGGVLVGEMDVALLRWLQEGFVDISGLHLDFNAKRPNVKTEEGRKCIMIGRMSSDVANQAVCSLSLAKYFPAPRLRAFFSPFKAASEDLLHVLRAKAFSLDP